MTQPKPIQLAIIGECMLEMSQQVDTSYQLNFAGDSYNVAYYAAAYRNATQLTIDYITALGDDPYSEQMLLKWSRDGLQVGLVQQISAKLPGLYLIHNDESGERHFYYYRSQAAAKFMFSGAAGDDLLNQLLQFDVWYLSSISLAILSNADRAKFFDALQQAAQQEIKICFDINYRPVLWESVEQAQTTINLVLQKTTIALPSADDLQQLYNDQQIESMIDRLRQANIAEIVLKQGKKGYYLADQQQIQHYPSVTSSQVVDTTGAGDSFNGVYLAMRLAGKSSEQAALQAAHCASRVVAHRGALLPNSEIPAEGDY